MFSLSVKYNFVSGAKFLSHCRFLSYSKVAEFLFLSEVGKRPPPQSCFSACQNDTEPLNKQHGCYSANCQSGYSQQCHENML